MKKLRFWVVSIMLLPILVPLCLLDYIARFGVVFFEWAIPKINLLGWAFCWLHRKLAGNSLEPFKVHMAKRHQF